MNDDRDAAPARDDRPPGYLLPRRLRLPDISPDPAHLASQIIDAVVPGFAEAAGVFVLEELLSGGNPADHAAGADVIVRELGAGMAVDGHLVPGAIFPPGAAIAFAADSPCARCLRDRVPVTFDQPDGSTLERMTQEAKVIAAGTESFLAAPMITRGTATGFLVLARAGSALAFHRHDTTAVADLAARASAAIASSLAIMRQGSVAEALQPRRPSMVSVAPARLEIVGRCLPAAGYEVGGDWYDIIPLPGERTGLIVGDVMGHGPAAAAIMARLSTVAFALADLGLPPSEVLRQLNRTALALPHSTLVTCAYAVIDPGGHACDLATAGHLPPVLAMPDGTTRVLSLPSGQSLGVTPAAYGQARVRLPPGTMLALYTDGLVETRTRPFDQGIAALRSVLSGAGRTLVTACDEIIAALGDHHEDDVTVVLAKVPVVD